MAYDVYISDVSETHNGLGLPRKLISLANGRFEKKPFYLDDINVVKSDSMDASVV